MGDAMFAGTYTATGMGVIFLAAEITVCGTTRPMEGSSTSCALSKL